MNWSEQLLEDVHSKLSPGEFEKLVYALLSSMGFSEVALTGKTGDGGIDLKGIWTPSQEFAPGLQITLDFVIQTKRLNPRTTLNPIYLRALKGSMRAGEWGLLITTGRISVATRQEGLKDADKIVSTIGGSELAELCAKYKVGVEQHFSFDKSFLRLKEEEEPPEPPLAKTVPNNLTTILTIALEERFQRIGKSPFYKSKTKLIIARWSQKYKRKGITYWFGLKAGDLDALKNQKITHFAYACGNKGVLLLPSSIILRKIKKGSLLKSMKNGQLFHYHIQLDAYRDELKWVLKNGVREGVEQYFHKLPVENKKLRK